MSEYLRMKLIRYVVIVISFVFLYGCAGFQPKEKPSSSIPLTILFFNDLHGYLESFDINGENGAESVGGIARMATLIRTIRKENEQKKVKTLVLVAGDLLQGTPMSTVFKGEPDITCLNAMGVNAMTVGNHEFDFGFENFQNILEEADFPFLSANIIVKKTGELLCPPSLEVSLDGQVVFTIIGVTTQSLMTTTQPSNVAMLDVLDSVSSVYKVYGLSKIKGPVLLLSHSRHETDRAFAMIMPHLAAIIGGHDQILLSPYRQEGHVPILQAFEKGRYLGRLDLSIDPVSKQANLVNAGYTRITDEIPEDPEIQSIVNDYKERLGQQFKEVIGRCETFMDGERDHIRYEETTLGNFVTDIMLSHTGAQIALINGGALRSSINKGPVTVEDVFKAMPYGNELVRVELTGAEINQVLQRGVYGNREDEDGGFLHVAGISFDIRDHTPENIRVGKKQLPLNPSSVYSVVIPDFLASGGDGHDVFKGKPHIKTGTPLRALIIETIREQKVVSAQTEGRINRPE